MIRTSAGASARELDLTPPGPDAAARRARTLRRRQRAGLAATTAVLVAAGGLGVWTALPNQDEQTTTAFDQSGSSAGAEATGPSLDLSWRAVDGTISWAGEVLTSSDGTTYALSTAPGVRYEDVDENFSFPMALYRTTDGETWESTPLGDDRALRDLAERDGLLYAISTAPGESSDDEVTAEVVTSSDGGTTWDQQPLPVEVTKPDADVPLSSSVAVDLAVADGLTVALVTASFYPDPSSLIEERFPDAPTIVWNETDGGLALTDTAECYELGTEGFGASAAGTDAEAIDSADCETPAGEVTWSELGVADPASLSQQHFFVRGVDGGWDDVGLDLPSDVGGLELYGTSSGLLLSAFGQDGSTVLFRSTDGLTWDEVATVGFSLELSVSGDRVIIAQDQSVLISTDGGASFAQVPVSSFIDGEEQTDENQAGVTNVAVGPLGFAVVVASPSPFAPAELESLEREAAEAVEEFEGRDEEMAERESPDYSVATSTNGASWSSTDLAEVGMAGDYVSQVMVGADHVGVVVSAHERDANGDLRHDVLLGTPER